MYPTDREIIENSQIYKPKRGIYFLIKDNIIVYIGQTNNFDVRIQAHIKEKDFDRYFLSEIYDENCDLDIMENNLIIEYKPKLNRFINKPKGYLSKKEMWAKYRLGKKFIEKNRRNIVQFTYGKVSYFREMDILILK